MRIGLVEAMLLRMREVDRASAPCAHCGELVASAYAEVFEERRWDGPGAHYTGAGTTAVVVKLCHACGNAPDDWIARGRPQVERDAEGLFTKGWLVQVTLRGHMLDPEEQ